MVFLALSGEQWKFSLFWFGQVIGTHLWLKHFSLTEQSLQSVHPTEKRKYYRLSLRPVTGPIILFVNEPLMHSGSFDITVSTHCPCLTRGPLEREHVNSVFFSLELFKMYPLWHVTSAISPIKLELG